MKRRSAWSLVYFILLLSCAICIADIRIHKDHGKRYQGFLPETVGAQRGMLGDGVDVESASLHNLEWGGVDPSSRRDKTRDQPAWKTIPKRPGADAQPRLTLGYQLDHVCKKWKLFNGPNQTRFRFTGLFTSKKEYRKSLTLCYSIPKNSWLLRRNKPKKLV